jgi:2-dehydropantoate 2-reductase
MAPYLERDASIVTLQNGVDNAERLARRWARGHPAVVYTAVEMAGPGHVRHHGRGELVIGRSAASEAIADAFGAAGVRGDLRQRRRRAVGQADRQLCLQRALGDHAASIRTPGAERWRAGRHARRGRRMPRGGAGRGRHVPGDMHEAVRRIAQTMPGQYSSTAQDLARRQENRDRASQRLCRAQRAKRSAWRRRPTASCTPQ